MATKEEKLAKHLRLARKHIRKIEELGYDVAVGHNELAVYDYSDAPPEEERNFRNFDPSHYFVDTIG